MANKELAPAGPSVRAKHETICMRPYVAPSASGLGEALFKRTMLTDHAIPLNLAEPNKMPTITHENAETLGETFVCGPPLATRAVTPLMSGGIRNVIVQPAMKPANSLTFPTRRWSGGKTITGMNVPMTAPMERIKPISVGFRPKPPTSIGVNAYSTNSTSNVTHSMDCMKDGGKIL